MIQQIVKGGVYAMKVQGTVGDSGAEDSTKEVHPYALEYVNDKKTGAHGTNWVYWRLVGDPGPARRKKEGRTSFPIFMKNAVRKLEADEVAALRALSSGS